MLETNILNSETLQPNSPFAFLQSDLTDEKAKKLHRLLLDLSKDESEKELRSIVRQTADFFREKFYGKTDAQIRTAIIEVLKDYFDGETYNPLEIDNLAEETGIKEDKLLPVLEKMVAEGILLQGRRRRYQEPGKHYNPIYKLKD